MKPTDNRSFLNFIFEQMDKLDRGEIDNDKATALSKLAKEANNSMMYEVKRADLLLRVRQSGIKPDEYQEVKRIEQDGTPAKLALFGNPYEAIDQINKESERRP